ncbi:hypothetical protein BRI6_1894 [plant metagenome]|uniref:Uncharacterized protein n=1 Tax=plant metagenome TaxID=1297885 RepID=A0A484T6U5_9ZZZZ
MWGKQNIIPPDPASVHPALPAHSCRRPGPAPTPGPIPPLETSCRAGPRRPATEIERQPCPPSVTLS